MNDATVAAAIAARLSAVTPPSGESAIRWAGYLLLDAESPPAPSLEILPPSEDIEWLPGRQMRSTTDWTVQLLLDSAADLPRRMASLYAWRTAIRTQLAGQIQLGIAGVELALLTGMRSPEDEFGRQLIDVLELSITVRIREVVATLSA